MGGMRAWVIACVVCLAQGEIDINVEMLVPAAAGLNISQFINNLKEWVPSANETFNSTNITDTNSTPTVTKGFFSDFNIRLALTGLENVLCTTGLNITRCYVEQLKETPPPAPEPPPVEAKASGGGGGMDVGLAAGIACASLGVVAILTAWLCSKRKAATRLVLRCIIRETIDWPPRRLAAQWPRGPHGRPIHPLRSPPWV